MFLTRTFRRLQTFLLAGFQQHHQQRSSLNALILTKRHNSIHTSLARRSVCSMQTTAPCVPGRGTRSARGVFVTARASSSSGNANTSKQFPAGKKMENFSRFVVDDSWSTYEEQLKKDVEAGKGIRSIDEEMACSENVLEGECQVPSGPYCPYLGPIPSLCRQELEVLYKQARESFYSGRPMLADSTYDDIELRLRLLRSPLVKKFPRCSLTKSRPMYADAEEDYVQVSLLAVLWGSLFLAGFSAMVAPIFFAWLQNNSPNGASYGPLLPLMTAVGVVVGTPLTTTAYRGFTQLKEGYLVAMRGQCPHCGNEVYAFMGTDVVADRPKFVREASECHVCGQRLEFRAFILEKKPLEVPGEDPVPTWSPIRKALKRWAYGRVYGRSGVDDLGPSSGGGSGRGSGGAGGGGW